MNALLDQVGHQEYLYETFVDATEETFGQVIDAIQKGVPDESFLVEIFNDFSQSMSIITHFRVRCLFPLARGRFANANSASYRCMDEIEPSALSSISIYARRPILCHKD
jgi:hypothetical protein